MEVIVQDANNIVIEVDQGRQGRGISTVGLVTVGADYYLLFTFTDGSTEQVGPIAPIVTEVLFAEARNAEATTILKGQPVYLFQAQGNLATVKLAFNTSDATSAKTLGLAAENIAPGAQGLITCQGTLGGLNTSAYSEGDTLYLGATAGTLTNVKPQAPNHLVYIGVVERANAGAGQIYVRVQNGYELDEIHDVLINSPVNGNTLIYDASTSLWKNAGITAGSGISVTNGASSITVGNTGVLSFSGGTTGLTPATATAGAVALAGTLSTANGGTGLSSFTSNGVVYASNTSTLVTGSVLTFNGTNLTLQPASGNTLFTVQGGTGGQGQIAVNAAGSARTFSILTNSILSYLDSSNGVAFRNTTGDFTYSIGGSEQMRLTSTGLGIGTSSPTNKLSVDGNANITGNVTLGDASTDIVTVNGVMGFGSGGASSIASINLTSSALTGVTQIGLYSQITGSSAGTANVLGVYTIPKTAASAYTASIVAGVRAGNAVKGAGSTITDQHGLYIEDQTQGTNNFGISSLVSSGANKWNIYASGTAVNYFNGNVGVGTTSPNARLQVTSGTAGRATYSSDADDIVVDSTGSGSGITIASDRASYGVIYFADQDSGTRGILRYDHLDNSLRFGAGGSELMRLDSSGNVGIGTTAPGTKLDVKQSGTNWYDGIRVVRSTNDNQRLVFGNTSGASWIASVDAAGGVNNELIFGRSTNGTTFTESGRFNATGNLLVGTTTNTNSSLLTVNGTISETVNSVQYLVASQFDVGTAPNKIPLNQYLGNLAYQNASAIAGRVGLSAGTAALPSIGSATDAATGEWFPATSVMAWSTGGSERMRLDASGNLGVGTSNPITRLQTVSSGTTVGGASGVLAGFFESNIAVGSCAKVVFGSTDGAVTPAHGAISGVREDVNASSVQGGLAFFSRPVAGSLTERMRLDAAGNLGLGVTPSAWVSGSPALQIGATGSLHGFGSPVSTSAFVGLSSNAYTVSSSQQNYITTQAAASYSQYLGAHRWFTAPSGTAGNAISFTQAMTLDANGRLLLGTTTASGQHQLQVEFSNSNASVGVRARNTSSAGTTSNTSFQLGNDTSEAAGALFQGASTYSPSGGANSLNLYNLLNAPLVFGTNNTERARITAAGDVLTTLQTTAPTLATNNQMVFTLTSNTNLRISVRGSDGVTRVANITLA